MAPALAVFRPATWAGRLPTVHIALNNIFLVYLIARRLCASSFAAVGAAIALMLTPAYLLRGSLACVNGASISRGAVLQCRAVVVNERPAASPVVRNYYV
jgi:hypothetical protein